MTPQQRWQRVQDLAEQAEGVPQPEREAYLSAREYDASIRAEALSLASGLENEPKSLASPLEKSALPEWIGPYKITGLLGQGGMGVVYAAELQRGGETQKVALKLILAKWSDPENAARFAREQKILARLDHPGITRMLDSGVSEDHQPYLVMERVEGQPLDRYCDSKTLSPAQRIRLMIDVCRAVEGAHRNLIVHLDLKPSNILVTHAGQVKLLDFGTAKLLHNDASLTTTRQLTPMYASPEQLRGEPVSTACDIYSLGLILYEQLSGAWPFGSRDSMMSVAARAMGSQETEPMEKAITEDSAHKRGVRPERLREQLRGDLNAIVAKALSPSPRDRYGTVSELADDLERFLDQRPILARKQTTLYRAKKYIARNRGALSITAVLAVALITMAGYAFWQQRQAVEAGRRAQATAQFLNWLIQTANPINGGATTRTVREMIERARPRIDRGLNEYPEVFAPLASTFGDFLINAGRPEAGVEWLKRSVDRSRQLGSKESLVLALSSYAITMSNSGRCPEAIGAEKEMKALLPQVESKLRPVDLVNIHTALAYPEEACDQDSEASLRSMERAYQYSKVIPNNSLDTDFPAKLFKGLLAVNYAGALNNSKRTADARRVINEGLSWIEGEPDANPVQVALLRIRSATEAEEMNYLVSARTLEEALRIVKDTVAPLDIVRLHGMLAIRLASAEQREEAITEAARTSEEVDKRLVELGPGAVIGYLDAALAATVAGDYTAGLRYARRANELAGGQIPLDHRTNYESALGICLMRTGSTEEGRKLVTGVIDRLKIAENPTRPLAKALRAALQ